MTVPVSREERVRRINDTIQVINNQGKWFVVHTGLVKSAGPFDTKSEANKFKRKAVREESSLK
jgi:hypothetical protein